jgi:hypothetical protein
MAVSGTTIPTASELNCHLPTENFGNGRFSETSGEIPE